MSSIVHKVKDAITPSHKSSSHTTGTHHAENTTTTGTSGLTGSHAENTTGLTGSHGTRTENVAHGTHNTTGYNNSSLPEGTTGHHNSRVANAADPRIDSDMDGSRNMGMNRNTGVTGTGTHGTHGSTGLTGSHGTSGLNNHSTTTGSTGPTSLTGSHGTRAENMAHGTHNTTGYNNSSLPEGTAGHHNSRVANAADPRIDSDVDGSRNMGMNRTTGATHGATTTGVTGSHAQGGLNNTSGPGPAPNTAGPHKSDMMNKVDVRVDSDRDGSKTLGKDKTYATNTTNMMHKDPTDAAQVPPSVLQKHVGPPTAAHGHAGHGISGQEKRHGL